MYRHGWKWSTCLSFRISRLARKILDVVVKVVVKVVVSMGVVVPVVGIKVEEEVHARGDKVREFGLLDPCGSSGKTCVHRIRTR